jgi:TRAP-type C4-dicarboxylate transport system substrate-binding protein
MPITDVLTGLRTELIDTIMSPPAAAIILQWNTGLSYITKVPLAYIFAMMVIDKKYFDRLQDADQAIVREVMERVYIGFEQQGNEDNEKAYQALLGDGMKSVTPNRDQVREWHIAIQDSNHKLAAQDVIDAGLLNELECYITAYREENLAKDCTGTP